MQLFDRHSDLEHPKEGRRRKEDVETEMGPGARLHDRYWQQESSVMARFALGSVLTLISRLLHKVHYLGKAHYLARLTTDGERAAETENGQP